MTEAIFINGRRIGKGQPVYVVAEMSGNHDQDFDKAVKIIEAAKESGADAVKLQTYTPDTITIDCDNEHFRIQGTIWEGLKLHDLYGEAYTPWDWQPRLKEVAESLGMDLFSTPFDLSAVEFLERMDVPAYKIASFENIDLPLIRAVARTGKPIIMSTGMSNLADIDEAVRTVRETGNDQLALLKCTSAYPAPPEEMNLRTIPHLAETFNLPVGLSDHTLGSVVAVAGVALGACMVEKHFTLSRKDPGPDSSFSMEPKEFAAMVTDIRTVEAALGRPSYEITEREKAGVIFKRSLFVVKDVDEGEPFTEENVRSIRPGHGLHPRYLDEVYKGCASRDLKKGTPLAWNMIREC
jgi:pseudaminic acid synthase